MSRHYVVLAEDLKSSIKVMNDKLYEHEWHGTFRGDKEWRDLFELLGYRLVQHHQIDPGCWHGNPHSRSTALSWPRALYVLTVP